MATLAPTDLDAVWAEIMEKAFELGWEFPVTKDKLKIGVQDIDAALNTAEVSIFQGITDAQVKSWLLANQSIGREVIVMIEQKRRDTL